MDSVAIEYRKKKILIVGSHGFIGSHLSSCIRKFGSHITTLSYTENQVHMERIIKKHFDVIFNCSGYSGEVQCEQNPLTCLRGNYNFSYAILEAIRKFSPKTKLVLIGSRLEYGKPHYLPVDETHPTEPLGIYGMSKLCANAMAIQYFHTYHIPITIVRVSNVYGVSMQKNQQYNIINDYINKARRKQPVVIFGKGNQLRDYLYISDLVDVLLCVGMQNRSNGKIYNIGFGKSIMFKDMVNEIIRKFPTKIVYTKWPKKFQQYETGDYVTDITKAKRELEWHPKIDFQEGIKNIHAFYE